MTLNNLLGDECPTEIAQLINAIIAQKATNSLDNLDAAGQKKFTDLANAITNVNDLVTALQALVNTKLSAEALLEQNGYIKFSNGLILIWGVVQLPVNGVAYDVVMPVSINFGMAGFCTPYSADIPDIVICPYCTGFTRTSIKITYDYETGHAYKGTGTNLVSWLAIAI